MNEKVRINDRSKRVFCTRWDYKKLVQIVLDLYLDIKQRVDMGDSGFKYYKEYFNIDNCIDNLNKIISEK
jgi:hypothetical protein